MLVEIAEETVSKLKDRIGLDDYGCDLHHYLWNVDYYIIGTYDAKKWIESHMSVFMLLHKYRNMKMIILEKPIPILLVLKK